ncbi:mitochondrial carrier domain-containing protein [Roridomyces roridus]|uniref:Mitochondrial carrier domain-containing protein n=1 Tax=Roridomyces roridus TaxID=1738132 RepID=A0AAD7FPD2_9AGAR|nr:mitochondrial carrier domain-containing protein [Roridomyces roridus]
MVCGPSKLSFCCLLHAIIRIMTSVRGLYNSDPSAAWSFQSIPTTSTANTSAQRPPSAPSYRWSSRPAHNSIFDLSPELADPSDGIDPINLLKTLAASAILQYASSAIAMPWEVGKLLLQVQWVPRDAGQPEPSDVPPEEDDEDALSDASNENDSYFADPNATPEAGSSLRPTDDQGYVTRRSVLEESTRPEYTIPVGSADGVWGMIRRVGRFRGEGWLALWKGLLTSCITEILSSTFQPMVRGLLQALLLPASGIFHYPPIFLPVLSHLIMGFILSPLDLVRTRLIVQSFSSRHRTYKGPLHALSTILREEGGLKGIYLHPHLFIPTIIDNLLPPIVSFVLPGMLASYVGAQITEDANPIAWGFAELAGSCLGLIITLPFETVRRRLQVQVRGTAKPIKGCVELRPVPYNGVVDAFWHILTEERSDLPITPSKRKRRGSTKGKEREDQPVQDPEEQSWLRNTGIGQLYRGLGMRLGASVIMFGLALFSGDESDGGGWAEL